MRRELYESGVTVVIPQRGQAGLTVACVEGLRRYERADLDVVVVDDGTDEDWRGERERLERAGGRIVSQPASGVTAAWNFGWRHAIGQTVVFLNNDVEVMGAFVERLQRPLKERAALVAGVEWRWEPLVPCRREAESGISGWQCLAGYCFAVRKAWLTEQGGMDERMRVYWSDTDLQWRARREGRTAALVRVEVAGAVRHLGHRTAQVREDRREVWRADRAAFVSKWRAGGEG